MRSYSVAMGGAVLVAVAALVAAIGTAAADRQQRTSGSGEDLGVAHGATASYHQVRHAEQDGYALLPEGQPLHECIDEDEDLDDQDGKPAMGLHYVNGGLLDGTVATAEPEVLVYEPTKNGRLRLVALEYVVFESAWGAPDDVDPPQLFGQDFMYVAEGNRYGLPAFYALHAWVWKHNPDGLLANMNPRVTCSHAP